MEGKNDNPDDSLSREPPNNSIKSYFAETRVKTHESVYHWKIRNLSHCYVKQTEKIYSPNFQTEVEDVTLEWYLIFYPSGRGDAPGDCAALIFQVSEEAYPEEATTVYVKWSILFQNEGCRREEVLHEDYITFSEDENTPDDYVIEEFLKKSEIHRFLHNGNLTIICRLYSYTGTIESEVSETPTTEMENQTTLDEYMREMMDFGKLFESEKFSDVTVVVGEEHFFAHKNVLSARSRVFAAMFEYNMQENKENSVTILDVESKVMREVLRFIYSAKVNNLESLAQGLLAAADKYELNGLKRMCEDVLIEKLSDQTVGEILLLADRHNADKLRTATLEFMAIHANELASVDSFNTAIKSLPPSLTPTVIKTLMLKM